MHMNPFTPADRKETQQLLRASPSLYLPFLSALTQTQSLLFLNLPKVTAQPVWSLIPRAGPPQLGQQAELQMLSNQQE